MTLNVEDGTGMANADSYVSVADCSAYHVSRGNQAWAAGAVVDQEAAIRRATFWVDPTYRNRFPGYQTQGRAQALEWPRTGAYVVVPDNGRSDALYFGNRRDYFYLNGVYYVPANTVPQEVITATCEAALRELVSPGVLSPDQTRDDLVTSFQVGPVKLTYGGGSPDNTIFQKIDLVLRSLLIADNPYSGRVTR